MYWVLSPFGCHSLIHSTLTVVPGKEGFKGVFWLVSLLACAPYGNRKTIPLNNTDESGTRRQILKIQSGWLSSRKTMVCTPASSGQCRTRNQQNDYMQPIPDCDAILLVMLDVNTANDTGWQDTCAGDNYPSAGPRFFADYIWISSGIGFCEYALNTIQKTIDYFLDSSIIASMKIVSRGSNEK